MNQLQRVRPYVPVVLSVLGLVLVSVGVGTILGLGAGLVAGGISFFVLEWRITS